MKNQYFGDINDFHRYGHIPGGEYVLEAIAVNRVAGGDDVARLNPGSREYSAMAMWKVTVWSDQTVA